MKHRSEDNFREYGTRRRRQEEIAAKMGAGGAQVAYTRRGRVRFAGSAFGADSAACAAAKKIVRYPLLFLRYYGIMCFRKTEGKTLREKTEKERQTKMRENGKPMLPTAEEAEALTPTIRKEMTARGATKVSITYTRIAGLKAMGDFPMENLQSLQQVLFIRGVIPVKINANTLGFAVRH